MRTLLEPSIFFPRIPSTEGFFYQLSFSPVLGYYKIFKYYYHMSPDSVIFFRFFPRFYVIILFFIFFIVIAIIIYLFFIYTDR